MATTSAAQLERTLDPQDWTELRELGHRMVDDMFAYLEEVRERPVWQRVPDQARDRLSKPAPQEPEGAESAYADFKRDILPYPTGNIHPRFWAWVCGTGSAGGMLAEMLGAAMNSNVHGGEHSAIYVEKQVIGWLKEALGYPCEASGLLVNGGSMANFVGLAVARSAKAGWDVRSEGFPAGSPTLRVYCSSETHSSLRKSVEALGVGFKNLRMIGVDSDFRIRLDELRTAVAADRAQGMRPICVVGNAATVNSGAIDDLEALADFCQKEDLWLHVDGAFGAIAAISPKFRPMLRGMERADSLAFDLHKWMYMPYDVGCVLVRSPKEQRAAFGYEAAYLNSPSRGVASGPLWFNQFGMELSRGFRALKVWFSLKEHGLSTYRALVEQNVEQCKYLAELVEADRRLELLAPVPLNVVCFRFRGARSDEASLAAVNQEIVLRLQEEGIASPSTTMIGGKFAIRVANVNHRTRREDFDILVREVVRLGEEMAG